MATKKDSEKVTVNQNKPSFLSNLISAIVALLFVGVAGYFIYTNFSDDLGLDTPDSGDSNLVEVTDDTNDIDDTDTPDANNEDNIIANSTVREDINDIETGTGTGGSVFGQWVANNYDRGDISRGSYTVKSGDTLWELAEGAYGSGYEWTIILANNSDNIGFLPNGQQALIYPGQIITI